MNKVGILDLFPIPVAATLLELDNTPYLNAVGPMIAGSHQSSDTYILDKPEFAALRRVLLMFANSFMQKVLCVDGTARITQSWVNKNEPARDHAKHRHPNSIASGVYYLDVPEGSSIVFHRSEAGNGFALQPAYTKDLNSYVNDTMEVGVATGGLIIFPSYLWHSVPPNLSDKDRWSLAFNCVTEAHLGDKSKLTELIF